MRAYQVAAQIAVVRLAVMWLAVVRLAVMWLAVGRYMRCADVGHGMRGVRGIRCGMGSRGALDTEERYVGYSDTETRKYGSAVHFVDSS